MGILFGVSEISMVLSYFETQGQGAPMACLRVVGLILAVFALRSCWQS
jgi:hypothetical protein